MSAFDEPEVWRGILENLPTGLCVIDLQKKIVAWSEGAERLTGHMRHEVIGHSCVSEALVHCDQPGCEFCREDCPMAQAIKTAKGAEASGFLHHKAGHEVPVRLRAVPVRNARGSVIGAVETFETLELPADAEQRRACLHQAGFTDALTATASRALMLSHVREALASFEQGHVPFGIFLFRVEGLEHFRAACGSEAAAALLRGAARTLEAAILKTDCVGRWSDDEFLVLVNARREDAVSEVRERMRHRLANHSIEWWGERHSLPVSIGQAIAAPGDDLKSVLIRATQSLEAAAVPQAGQAASAGNRSSGS